MPETRDHVAECRELEAWLRDNAAVHSALSASARARMVKRADALAALLAEREWRPIAGAPKDGTDVMLYWRNPGEQGTIDQCYWDGERKAWLMFCEHHDSLERWQGGYTHWLPLPAPPHPEE